MDVKTALQTLHEIFNTTLLDIAGTPLTVGSLLLFAAILLASWVVSRIVQAAMVRALRLRNITGEGSVGVSRRLVHYLIMFIGFGVAFQTVGVDLSALFAAGAVFAIGLGFAMQNIAQNFVSGVILLLERTIKPGDVLQVDGRFVKVREMGIRATIGRTLDEEEIIVPNSLLVQSVVTNYTLRDSSYRLRCTVGVTYDSDMELVRKTLQAVGERVEWRIQGKGPVVFMTGFGDSSVNFEVSVWVDDPWRQNHGRSNLNTAIWWALKDAGVTIAFPQLDVHFDPPVMDSLTALRKAS